MATTFVTSSLADPANPNSKVIPKLTAEGEHALDLLNKINIAINANQDQSFAWFKGIDVYPSPDNVLEFADELQEYIKFTGKKSIWDETLLTGDYIKWDYWAQESRPDKPILPGSPIVVNNIVGLGRLYVFSAVKPLGGVYENGRCPKLASTMP